MNLALSKAWEYQLLTYPNPAVGCLILDKNGKILSINAHKKAGFLHAEPNAIFEALCKLSQEFLTKFIYEYELKFGLKFASLDEILSCDLEPNFTYDFICQNHQNLLKDSQIFVTLEPCSHDGKTKSCAKLIANLKPKVVKIAVCDENKIASGGSQILKDNNIAVEIGICKDSALKLLEPFLAWSKGNFSFFKIALTQNGASGPGRISNEATQIHCHNLRSLVDLMVIGGASVRADRPSLDSRLFSQKSPDILVYSRSVKFDKTIPLFSVKNRNVFIENSLKRAFDCKFTMFEGGENFLRNLDERVRWIAIYKSPNLIKSKGIELDLKLKLLFSQSLKDNQLEWYERQ